MNYLEKIRRLNPQLNMPPVEVTVDSVHFNAVGNHECKCGKMLFMSFGPRGYEYLHRSNQSRFCDFGSSNRTAEPK